MERALSGFDAAAVQAETSVEDGRIRIAVIGRPNVGKSTLVNRLIGDDRVIASDMPGTTRDSIFVPFERDDRQFTLIDTAGVRRRGKVEDAVEKASVAKTLQAIDTAHVVIFVVDAHDSIGEQDASVLGLALARGRALLIAVNKWDGIPMEQRDEIRRQLELKLDFVPYAPVHFISARHGTGVGELVAATIRAYDAAMTEIPTPKLSKALERAAADHRARQPDRTRARGLHALPRQRVPPRVRPFRLTRGGRVPHGRQSVRSTQGPPEAESRKRAGSTKARLSATPQCRWGPVTRPVAPTSPIF